MSEVQRADETLWFSNNEPIVLSYKNTISYFKRQDYDRKILEQSLVWHQIVVHHQGNYIGDDGFEQIIDGIFHAVESIEFYPIAYRRGDKEDRFLVRQCVSAMEKLFARYLRIQLRNGRYLSLTIELNVGEFNYNQISPPNLIVDTIERLYKYLLSVNGIDGILNLENFGKNKEFKDVIINMSNRGVLDRVFQVISGNEDKFRITNGLILSNNNITILTPIKVFNNCEFSILDLRHNCLRSVSQLCKDLKDIKADDLYLTGNPLLDTQSYPELLQPIFHNFKRIDGKDPNNLLKDYSPMDYDIDTKYDGYRIDASNRADIRKFHKSIDWHGFFIPDLMQDYTKEEILDYFFITVSTELDPIYPCYYKHSNGEHQFLVRICYQQIEHLVNICKLEIPIPRFTTIQQFGTEPQIQFDKPIKYYLRMNISPFKSGQVEPEECIDLAITHRFNPNDRLLNLEKFQSAQGLENIFVNLSSPRILNAVMIQAAKTFHDNCVELRLCDNKILTATFSNSLKLMSRLKAIDLSINWIQELDDIQDLRKLNLKSIRLDGNPLCSKYAFVGEYVKAVKGMFPGLLMLDDVEITSKGNLSTQKNFLCNVEGYDFVENFIPTYFKTFESENRKHLIDFYHTNAVFTIICNYAPIKVGAHNLKRIAKYSCSSRNILNIMDEDNDATAKVHYGPKAIMSVLMTLPKMSFDMLTFSVDTPIFTDSMIVIIVNGAFLDQPGSILDAEILMAFTRTFVLTPVDRNVGTLKYGKSYQITNEQFWVYNPTQLQSKVAFKYFKSEDRKTKTDVTLADRESLLVMFRDVTGLKSIWCSRCLEDSKWNFKNALDLFRDLQKRGDIPNTAFV